MEERVPPVGDAHDDPPLHSTNATFPQPQQTHLVRVPQDRYEPQETYVVKVPRDQVYRVPPPENAIILENYTRKAPKQSTNRCCRPCCWIIGLVFLLFFLIGVAIFIISATLYTIKSPEIDITKIHMKNMNLIMNSKNSSTNPLVFEILLHAGHLNPRISLSFGPSQASLIFKNEKIVQGGIMSTFLGGPQADGQISVILLGKGIKLSSDIKKRLSDTTMEKMMHLKMAVPMNANSWVKTEMVGLTIACDFKVKKTVISYQECHCQIH